MDDDKKNSKPEDRLAEARAAMEGSEHAVIRAKREAEQVAREKRARLTNRLKEIEQDKERLELKWVELDDKRKTVRAKLDPLIAEENTIEAEERKTEEEEQQMGLLKEKQVLEKKRWLLEDQRRAKEEEKWKIEDQLWKIEAQIDENTKNYQALLDEEDQIHAELEKL